MNIQNKINLTPRQQECLNFIRKFQAENKHSPTYSEIGVSMDPKISEQSVKKLVDRLAKRGYLITLPKCHRTITLLNEPVPGSPELEEKVKSDPKGTPA